MRVLHEEHRHRSAYMNYLQQSRLTLLQIRSYLSKLINKVQWCDSVLHFGVNCTFFFIFLTFLANNYLAWNG